MLQKATMLTKRNIRGTDYRSTIHRASPELKESLRQALLPYAPDETLSPEQNGVSRLNGGFSDSAFADNKIRPIHRWVPWIAGFSSEFVRDAFNRYLSNKPSAVV